MSQFIGFECDSCGKVISTEDRNKVTTRYEGPAARGEFSEDRCSECVVVPNAAELRPLRRRRTKKEIEADARRDTPVLAGASSL